MSHQSITKIRAGAHGEGKCEFSGMRKTSSCPETGHLLFYKRCTQTAFLTLPHQREELRKKTHKTDLAKKIKSRHKENKDDVFMHISSA